jgi:hypothetical protein
MSRRNLPNCQKSFAPIHHHQTRHCFVQRFTRSFFFVSRLLTSFRLFPRKGITFTAAQVSQANALFPNARVSVYFEKNEFLMNCDCKQSSPCLLTVTARTSMQDLVFKVNPKANNCCLRIAGQQDLVVDDLPIFSLSYMQYAATLRISI